MESKKMMKTPLRAGLGTFAWKWLLGGLFGMVVYSPASLFAEEAHVEPIKQTKVRTVYPKKTELDFEGAEIQGEVQTPGEFYFEHRPEEKYDSLVRRRK